MTIKLRHKTSLENSSGKSSRLLQNYVYKCKPCVSAVRLIYRCWDLWALKLSKSDIRSDSDSSGMLKSIHYLLIHVAGSNNGSHSQKSMYATNQGQSTQVRFSSSIYLSLRCVLILTCLKSCFFCFCISCSHQTAEQPAVFSNTMFVFSKPHLPSLHLCLRKVFTTMEGSASVELLFCYETHLGNLSGLQKTSASFMQQI